MCGQSVKQTAKVYFYFSTMGPNTFEVFLSGIGLLFTYINVIETDNENLRQAEMFK